MGGRPLGQHFLHDQEVIERILAAAAPGPADRILEIGPGRGALTYPLAMSGARVLAVELDAELAGRLKPAQGLEVVCRDILQTDIEELLKEPGWKVVANLPYYITTPILERLLSAGHGRIDQMWLMMQHEVGERIVSPGQRQSGSLTHFVRFHASANYLFKVPPRAFHPPPEVDSCVLHFHLHDPPPECRPRRFFEILRRAFGQRRKMLRSSLKGLVSDQQFAAAGVEPQRRPETLLFEDFVRLEQCSRPAG